MHINELLMIKVNAIAVMDKNYGVYLFDTSKVQLLERIQIETEASREEERQIIK